VSHEPRSSTLLVVGLFVLVLAAALVPWLLGAFDAPFVAPPTVSGEPPKPRAPEPEPEPQKLPIEKPPDRPRKVEAAPSPAPPPAPVVDAAPPGADDRPWIDRLEQSLVSFGGGSPDVDAVLAAVADLLAERPPKKSGEAGMPNKVEVKLADKEKSANVYVLATGDASGERYDVTIDVPRGPLPDEMRDKFERLLNCRFFIEVKVDGSPHDVRGAVRFQPITEESRIGAPFVAGWSIGTFEEGQRLVPFMTEVVRETDQTIGYRTKTDEALSITTAFADAARLVEVIRPAYADGEDGR